MLCAGGSVGGLHKSMTRLSSSQQINAIAVPPTPPLANNVIVTGTNKWGIPNMRVLSGGVTVTTISQPRMQRPHSQGPLTLVMPSTSHTSNVSVELIFGYVRIISTRNNKCFVIIVNDEVVELTFKLCVSK